MEAKDYLRHQGAALDYLWHQVEAKDYLRHQEEAFLKKLMMSLSLLHNINVKRRHAENMGKASDMPQKKETMKSKHHLI